MIIINSQQSWECWLRRLQLKNVMQVCSDRRTSKSNARGTGDHYILLISFFFCCLLRVATFESIQNSLTFPWQNSFPWQFLLFFNLSKKTQQILTVINGNSPTQPGFLNGKSLTVIISKPWVYICQADIYINTTQVEPLSYDGSFNLNIISW